MKGKRVLLRVDLNVPMENGKVTDATRIERVAPTITEIADKGGKVILLAHFGRPKGRDPEGIAEAGRRRGRAKSSTGRSPSPTIASASRPSRGRRDEARRHPVSGEHPLPPGEEKNDPAFVDALAKLGDIWVNDAFSAAHRAHASTEGLGHKLPAYAGRTMQAELEALSKALEHPQRPVVAIVGGAKVSTKLDLLDNLIGKVDALVIGGAMANTFLHARASVGKSLVEKDLADTARGIMDKAKAAKLRDHPAGRRHRGVRIRGQCAVARRRRRRCRRDGMILDIGPRIDRAGGAVLARAKTLVWNGPLGAFEMQPFDSGTVEVAEAAAELTKAGKLVRWPAAATRSRRSTWPA